MILTCCDFSGRCFLIWRLLADVALRHSLPEFLDFKLLGKTNLVVYKKWGLSAANPLDRK